MYEWYPKNQFSIEIHIAEVSACWNTQQGATPPVNYQACQKETRQEKPVSAIPSSCSPCTAGSLMAQRSGCGALQWALAWAEIQAALPAPLPGLHSKGLPAGIAAALARPASRPEHTSPQQR